MEAFLRGAWFFVTFLEVNSKRERKKTEKEQKNTLTRLNRAGTWMGYVSPSMTLTL